MIAFASTVRRLAQRLSFLVLLALASPSDNVIVESEIVKPDGTPVSLKYLMRKNGEDWQIADIYLDGTISEMAARRSEFSTILQRQGIDGLAQVLSRKADALIAAQAR